MTYDPKRDSITPEALFLRRRELMKGAGVFLATAGGVGSSLVLLTDKEQRAKVQAAATTGPGSSDAGEAQAPAPPAQQYKVDEPLTSYDNVTTYNNFYEFGTGKGDPARNAHTLRPRPWTLDVAGEVKPRRLDMDQLAKWFAPEERVYRFRCVEAWSMVIPWLGFPLAALVKRLEPNSKAKYVSFTTLLDEEQMPGQKSDVLPWPYVEALRLDEAMHPLAFMATGLYGKTLPNQNGAPIRLVTPWKYGFKGCKSIVKIEFTAKQPRTTWNDSAPSEYGFYANVNPEVDHPRWSQATERRIGELRRRKTLMFNGYPEVASLYKGMDLKANF